MPETVLDRRAEVDQEPLSFRAVVAEGGLANLPTYLEQENLADGRAFVITDSNVEQQYGKTMTAALDEAGISNERLVMPAGEEHKTWDQAGKLVGQLVSHNAHHSDVIIAMGGGVVGDVAGYVASAYERGTPLVQVPTTLLAMVDASVGGKTGVNFGGKNKAGQYYQPKLIVADPTTLGTLTERVYTEGFGEVVKYGMLDADFLPELEAAAGDLRKYSPANLEMLGKLISRCVDQKIAVVTTDPQEEQPNGRILLNYGHTLGHALEAAGDYQELLHGEAVAVGMTYAARLAVHLSLAEQSLADRQMALLKRFVLPVKYYGEHYGHAGVKKIMGYMSQDKKNKKNTEPGMTPFILPKAVGEMVVQPVDDETVTETLKDFLVT